MLLLAIGNRAMVKIYVLWTLRESCEGQRVWQLLQMKSEKDGSPAHSRTPQERRSGEPAAKGAGALFKRRKMNLEQSQPYRAGERCSSKVCLRTNQSHFFEGSWVCSVHLTILIICRACSWFSVGLSFFKRSFLLGVLLGCPLTSFVFVPWYCLTFHLRISRCNEFIIRCH